MHGRWTEVGVNVDGLPGLLYQQLIDRQVLKLLSELS